MLDSHDKACEGSPIMLVRLIVFVVLVTPLSAKSLLERFCKAKREVAYADCRSEGRSKDSCRLEAETGLHSCMLDRIELQRKLLAAKQSGKESLTGKVFKRLLTIGLKAI